ncbi:hypothetical protein [Nocardioides sp. R-C-SC26]|uniref:hypothetical protein n=1 Tax=Nocardioides sp. R-C-SC26 TaxID=2870414 RepID=UPI001E4AAF87|nr:hypothetical protein [Nocardioides sp. R-C-SC26]
MSNPATPTDLTNRGYTVDDDNVAQTWLDVAWRALVREVPSIPARVASGELTDGDVVDVVCAATMRVLRNPEGYESESGGVDDYQESIKRADASMDVYFTAAEIRRLAPSYPETFAGSVKYSR